MASTGPRACRPLSLLETHMSELILNFNQSIFSLVILGAIAGVGGTLLFLVGILLKEIRNGELR